MKIDTLCFTNVTLVAHQETICSNGSLYDGKQFHQYQQNQKIASHHKSLKKIDISLQLSDTDTIMYF